MSALGDGPARLVLLVELVILLPITACHRGMSITGEKLDRRPRT